MARSFEAASSGDCPSEAWTSQVSVISRCDGWTFLLSLCPSTPPFLPADPLRFWFFTSRFETVQT